MRSTVMELEASGSDEYIFPAVGYAGVAPPGGGAYAGNLFTDFCDYFARDCL